MHNRGGFTIVETLIVLAVTGVLFISVIASITDRQNRVQFSQGMREIVSQIQDVFNDVATSYFPSINGMQCSAPAIPTNPSPQLSYTAPSAGEPLGTRADCVVAGRVMQFGLDTTPSDDPSDLLVYTMVGRRVTFLGDRIDNSKSFAELKPVALDPLSAYVADVPELMATETSRLPGGITIVDSTKNPAGKAIGVFFSNFLGSASPAAAGTTSLAIAEVYTNAKAAMLKQNVINVVDGLYAVPSPFLTSGQSVKLCFLDAGRDREAVITIFNTASRTPELEFDVDLTTVDCL